MKKITWDDFEVKGTSRVLKKVPEFVFDENFGKNYLAGTNFAEYKDGYWPNTIEIIGGTGQIKNGVLTVTPNHNNERVFIVFDIDIEEYDRGTLKYLHKTPGEWQLSLSRSENLSSSSSGPYKPTGGFDIRSSSFSIAYEDKPTKLALESVKVDGIYHPVELKWISVNTGGNKADFYPHESEWKEGPVSAYYEGYVYKNKTNLKIKSNPGYNIYAELPNDGISTLQTGAFGRGKIVNDNISYDLSQTMEPSGSGNYVTEGDVVISSDSVRLIKGEGNLPLGDNEN